ncbi:P-II family nitrogen regulator [Bacteriovoracales bacterium]|nr:P-II family nitrogen regulator [Bacteriovoracales bacterium]
MFKLNKDENFSLVKAIVGKNKGRLIADDELLSCCQGITVMKARGTLLRPKWYQSFLPSINPEQEILEMLVPNHNLDYVMAQVSMKGGLHRHGAGGVFAFPCQEAMFIGEGTKNETKKDFPKESSGKLFRDDLVSIICIVQIDKANAIAKEAMIAGAPGPTISYGFGRGLRDRLGIVRVCISPEKELMSVVANRYEADRILDVMIRVGRLDVPGEGFIYTIPVKKGLNNVQSVLSDSLHGVSIPQIIKAIDEIKGSTDWRSNSDISEVSKNDGQIKVQERVYLENLIRLTCVSIRGEGEKLIKAALNAGAPGASVAYGRQMGEEKTLADTSIKLSNEREIIQLTLSPDKVQEILDAILEEATKNSFEDVYFYTHVIPKAFTYLGPPK